MESFFNYISSYTGTFVTVIIVVLTYLGVKWLFDRQQKGKRDSVMRQIIMAILVMIGLIMIILSLPIGNELKGQITSLMGIVLSAAFALSSTTFLGNALAGIMNRSINHFQVGDFIRVGDHFGKVSDMGLFHTEIQNETRDLTTLPNLFLATNAVRVFRDSGTIISTTCSLGYDVNRLKVEKYLLKAAEKVELSDAYISVIELGDYSVVYKVNGLLKNPERNVTAVSRLNKAVLDELHSAKIEIMSPAFYNRRDIDDTLIIPKGYRTKEINNNAADPELMIFDKALQAETLEKKNAKVDELTKKIAEMKDQMKQLTDEEAKERAKERIDKWEKLMLSTKEKIAEDKSKLKTEDDNTVA